MRHITYPSANAAESPTTWDPQDSEIGRDGGDDDDAKDTGVDNDITWRASRNFRGVLIPRQTAVPWLSFPKLDEIKSSSLILTIPLSFAYSRPMRKYERIKTLSNHHKWKLKIAAWKYLRDKNIRRDNTTIEMYNNSNIQFSVIDN